MKSKTEIITTLKDELIDDYLIEEIRWGSDDCGTLIEIFVDPKDSKRLRNNLKSTWYTYPTIVITRER